MTDLTWTTNKYEFELLFLSHVVAGIIPLNVCCEKFHDNYNNLTRYRNLFSPTVHTEREKRRERESHEMENPFTIEALA